MTQTIKNPPAMQETWVRSLGWEDPLEERKATHSSITAWSNKVWGGKGVWQGNTEAESLATTEPEKDTEKGQELALT